MDIKDILHGDSSRICKVCVPSKTATGYNTHRVIDVLDEVSALNKYKDTDIIEAWPNPFNGSITMLTVKGELK